MAYVAAPYICKDCKDSGLSTFYYDSTAKRNVFTYAQYLELDRSYQSHVRPASAVCDCDKGMRLGRRETMVETGPRNHRRKVLLWPRMEDIRKLSGEIPEQLDLTFDPVALEAEQEKADPKLVPLPTPKQRELFVRDPSGPQVEVDRGTPQ